MIYSYGSMASINPIRYRGYYYDSETGFYYLQNRYYDPSICRFINADAAEYSELDECSTDDANLFAYCNNNPVNYSDKEGEIGQVALVVIGAAAGAGINILSSLVTGQEVQWENVLGSAVAGATGVLSMQTRVIGACFAGVTAYCASRNSGNSEAESLFYCGMSIATSFITPGNVALAANLIDKSVNTIVADSIFSAGSSFTSAAISSGISISKQSNRKTVARKSNQRKSRTTSTTAKKRGKSIFLSKKKNSTRTSVLARLRLRIRKFRFSWSRK